MKLYEFGKENKDVVVLIHPSLVTWDYFEYVIPLLKDDYHVVVPAVPGYDLTDRSEFTSVEEIALNLAEELISRGIREVGAIYGCSMGGSIVARMLADNTLEIKSAVIDGGITPYKLPWIVTRFIAVKDFLLIYTGKIGGAKLLEKAFSTDELSEEDVQYAAKVLKMISAKTIWRTFESCNNYSMPKDVQTDCKHIEYWVADKEVKDRKPDIARIKEYFPHTVFRKVSDVGHGGLAPFNPERFVRGIERACKEGRNA